MFLDGNDHQKWHNFLIEELSSSDFAYSIYKIKIYVWSCMNAIVHIQYYTNTFWILIKTSVGDHALYELDVDYILKA